MKMTFSDREDHDPKVSAKVRVAGVRAGVGSTAPSACRPTMRGRSTGRGGVWDAATVSSHRVSIHAPTALALQTVTALADAEGVDLTASEPPASSGDHMSIWT
jgi:hypothetical protein